MYSETEAAAKSQKAFSSFLFIISLIFEGWQIGFLIWNAILYIELVQVDPILYHLIYVPVTLGVLLIWIGLHHFFVRKYRPDERQDPNKQVSSMDLARVRALQVSLVTLTLFLVCSSLLFASRYPGSIAPGDGHIVQNGMDTKSGLYTMWIINLLIVTIGGVFSVVNASYLFDLYMNQFRKVDRK